jgi:glycosyltransferase 2 family protein
LNPQHSLKIVCIKTIRIVVAAVPVVWIFTTIDWHKMSHAVFATAWWTIPLLFVTIMSGMILQGFRWWMLMKPFDPSLPFLKTMKAHFLGLYYSIVLPTSAAQDIVRAMILSKTTDYSLSWASTWLSRVLGLLVLGIMSIFGLFGINRSGLPPFFFESVVSAFGILALMFIFSFSKRFTSPFRKLTRKISPAKLQTILEKIRESVYKYRDKTSVIFIVFCITVCMELTITMGACLVIMGISGRFLPYECLLYLPIIEILCISIPLTPNGIGVREGLLALMFKQVGLSQEQLGIYIVLGFFSISLKLVGGCALFFRSSGDMQLKKK